MDSYCVSVINSIQLRLLHIFHFHSNLVYFTIVIIIIIYIFRYQTNSCSYILLSLFCYFSLQQSPFPLDELVNAIAEAAIAGHIPFTKLKVNKNAYGSSEPLQIPILLLRADDLFRTTGHKINFKLINAQPISIPVLGESISCHNHNHYH